MDRRTFVTTTACSFALHTFSFGQSLEKLRVGVIGHTGRGNFGHGLDTVWLQLTETPIVSVADANEAGLVAAEEKLHINNGFADYRQMLAEVKPDIVAVCPRQPDQHRDMILAAIETGASGIYVEKPFCRTPAEADEIVAACEKHNAKLAVAHRNRYHPTLQAIDKLIADGTIGKLLEIRGRGKGDRRGGAEDLWVLGSHVLNLIHYFGGAPKSCSAVLLQDGRRVTKADVREGNEALGLLAGNEIHARYEMERGLIAYFDSIANDGTRSAGFGLQIIGSEGLIDINCDKLPLAYLVPGNPFQPTGDPRPWIPITSAGPGETEPIDDLADLVSHHVSPARDLVAAIRSDRQPLCSVYDGAMTVEMICATFASHRESSKAVAIPLEARGNELARL
ncbi:MAG: Gfo/Idh/MocA family oxidoreductase [Planctomycetes bacterium]|nr:Gfo/Idh/MocA family oxidoreductase [Planctomycetota bacterium]